MFSYSSIPESFHRELQRFAQRWRETAIPEVQQTLELKVKSSPEFSQQLSRTLIGSEFVAKSALDYPEDFVSFLSDGCTDDCYGADQLQRYVEKKVCRDSIEAFDGSLRKIRREFMWWIIWRDLNRLASLEQTTAHLSDFASACLQTAIDFHYQHIATLWGVPVSAQTNIVQPFIVLGMGKLGAHELNLSSDIDLIFVYPESGETVGGSSQQHKSNQEFFIRLGQKVIQSLDTVSPEGMVFRVDMRLRPYGDSGALVMNFLSLENYYETQGREWERYAMIKARPVAQSSDELLARLASNVKHQAAGKYVHQLMSLLKAFTYRIYVDFSAIDSLREMKQLINKEVQRKGLSQDVKLGAGGIREVEFIAQVFQLVRGGRDTQLQERSLLKVLPLLAEDNMLPPKVVEQLLEAYRFLRNTEHAIQAYQDQQTQSLPADDLNQQRLAWVMGCANWSDFYLQLQTFRQFVRQQFAAVIADPETDAEQQRDGEWGLLWLGSLTGTAAEKFLWQHNIKEGENFCRCLEGFRQSRAVASMQATARDRLDLLMPPLLDDISESDNPVVSLQRICPLLEAIARRSVYLVLLQENPSARIQLAKLCAASPWIAQQLQAHPALLDELLDAGSLYSPPQLEVLKDQLRREVLRLSWDDLEGHMETLRYFHKAHALRVAACEVIGSLPLMKVSDYLTWLAEVILQHVTHLCWHQLTAKHGKPQRKISDKEDKEDCVEADFIVVGYGKLGGIELGHGSDLDLVFIHNGDTHLSTDGEREIDNQTFFTRLGQKIIHFLNTHTVSGQLYEVDMRLRPSGNKGLLVSSLAAFEKYQREDAWVWEHQALVRARPVAGSGQLATDFNQLREKILCQSRELGELQEKVTEMRAKMRSQLGTQGQEKRATQFHLKQDAGGIVDIEFMVQYAVLAWAHQYSGLVQYTDNIRILECLERANLLPSKDVKRLIEIYISYRSMGHSLALQGVDSIVSSDQFQTERAEVTTLWQSLFSA
jgi:glutamate-ammonia-ligase adenylyltransferase